MRFCLIVSFLTAAVAAQSTTSPPEQEPVLRERVAKFYAAISEGKYKNAFALVADDAQDAFMGMPKAPMKDVAIATVEGLNGGKTARVVVTFTRNMTMMGRPIETKGRDESRWRIEGEEWVWAGRPAGLKTTPLGMPVKEADPAAPGVPKLTAEEIKRKAAEMPSAEQLKGGDVRVAGPSKIEFSKTKPGEVSYVIQNPIQAWVVAKIQLPKLQGLEWVVPEEAKRPRADEAGVRPGSTVTVKIRWTPGAAPGPDDDHGRLDILPVSRFYQFQIVWKD